MGCYGLAFVEEVEWFAYGGGDGKESIAEKLLDNRGICLEGWFPSYADGSSVG